MQKCKQPRPGFELFVIGYMFYDDNRYTKFI